MSNMEFHMRKEDRLILEGINLLISRNNPEDTDLEKTIALDWREKVIDLLKEEEATEKHYASPVAKDNLTKREKKEIERDNLKQTLDKHKLNDAIRKTHN